MPAALTPLAVLVLGLVAERPMHPYEMMQTLIARDEDRFANIRPGSIYHTVARLQERELIRVDEVERAGNRPERTVYAATARGTAVLHESLSTMLGTPVPEFPTLHLALAECHELPRDLVIDLLERRIETMSAEHAHHRRAQEGATARGVAEMFLLDLGFRCATLAAQIDWLTNLRTRLADGALPWAARTTPAQFAAAPGGNGGRSPDTPAVVGTPAHHEHRPRHPDPDPDHDTDTATDPAIDDRTAS